MAQPIRLELPPRDPRIELQTKLEKAPIEHAEALLSAYEVLQGLHEKGVLEVCRGLLGSSDKVLEIGVEAANQPEAIRGLRNLMLVVNMLGAIDPEELAAFTKAVPLALQEIQKNPEPPSLWKLAMSFLWDKNIRRAIGVSATFLKILGSSLGQAKKSA